MKLCINCEHGVQDLSEVAENRQPSHATLLCMRPVISPVTGEQLNMGFQTSVFCSDQRLHEGYGFCGKDGEFWRPRINASPDRAPLVPASDWWLEQEAKERAEPRLTPPPEGE